MTKYMICWVAALLLAACNQPNPVIGDQDNKDTISTQPTTIDWSQMPTRYPQNVQWAEEHDAPGFVGAEGFGMYTTGGNGGNEYHVTSLEDNAKSPQPGTLRYLCERVTATRRVVFDIEGEIALNGPLKIKYGNVTIDGSTCPSEIGITITGYPVTIEADNVILRYLRFRVGSEHVSEHEGDGLGAMDHHNIIVDHCSIYWSVDECCSVYGGRDITVQWCIIAQSMRNCGHSKGTHGYGGNWGGSGCTYAYNLLCHHDSRTPRLGPRVGTQMDERLDMRCNVIYNWAGNGCYGGEGMNVNIVNNYYKPGPATDKRPEEVKRRIASIGVRTEDYCHTNGQPNSWYPMLHHWGKFYIDGNVNADYAEVTVDNWTYGVYNQQRNDAKVDSTWTATTMDTIRLQQPIPIRRQTTVSAEQAYRQVLAGAGCCLYDQDSVLCWDPLDAIMLSDTRSRHATYGNSNGLPGIIDSEKDCR